MLSINFFKPITIVLKQLFTLLFVVSQILLLLSRKHREKIESNTSGSCGLASTLGRLCSPSFTRPFLCIGALRVFSQWGEMCILLVYMITIFKQSKSSIEPELAPVFVGIIQVNFLARKSNNW